MHTPAQSPRPIPDVSVIIGAYNAMPYLTQCVESVIRQSIGSRRMEIITVNDGSTDTTGAELERLADRHPGLLRVAHQENSGGPAGPRNRGLDIARGRYVFFLDADDYLGTEALERLVTMADTHQSDVVLGKMVGVGGRKAPTLAYREHRTHATVFDSRVYWNLTVMKLFRRSLVERLQLRFLPELKLRQDQPFCATAYLHAANISVLNNYDCVYWVFRDDGANITRRIKGTEYRVRALRVMLELLGREVPAGPDRDKLVYRHLTTELRATLGHLRTEELPDVERQRLFDELQALLTTWHSPAAAERLPAIRRLPYEIVRHGTLEQLLRVGTYTEEQLMKNGQERLRNSEGLLPDEIAVRDGRAYAVYPYFGDPMSGVPESAFDCTAELRGGHFLRTVSGDGDGVPHLTGWAGLPRVREGDLRITAVLRQRGGTTEYTVRNRAAMAADATPERGEFTFRLDPATLASGARLPDGVWDLWLELETGGLRHRLRAGRERDGTVESRPTLRMVRAATIGSQSTTEKPEEPADQATLTVYYTAKHGNLSLDMGGTKHQPLSDVEISSVTWGPSSAPAVRVTGTSAFVYPEGGLWLTARNGDAAPRRVPVTISADTGDFTADLPLGTDAGEWTLALRCAGAERPVHTTRPLATKRWYRGGLPWYAKQLSGGKTLTIRMHRVRAGRALLARLRR